MDSLSYYLLLVQGAAGREVGGRRTTKSLVSQFNQWMESWFMKCELCTCRFFEEPSPGEKGTELKKTWSAFC